MLFKAKCDKHLAKESTRKGGAQNYRAPTFSNKFVDAGCGGSQLPLRSHCRIYVPIPYGGNRLFY